MQLPFGHLQLVNALPQRPGLCIRSPVSGQVHALEQSPILAAAAGFYGAGITVQLQGHQMFAPFDGLWSRQDQAGQQLTLQHPQGLRLQMRFPPACAKQHGLGFDWQTSAQSQVKAGQLLLNFDCALMQQWCKPLLLTITLPQHDKLSRILCRQVYHQANIDTLFFIDVQSTS